MIRSFLPLLVVCSLAGCSGPKPEPGPTPVDITGKVQTAVGRPVGNVMLTLHPQSADAQGQRPTVPVKADGSFAASCLPGTYKVTLTPLPNAPGDGAPGGVVGPAGLAPNALSGYTSEGGTPLSITVKAGTNEPFTLTTK